MLLKVVIYFAPTIKQFKQEKLCVVQTACQDPSDDGDEDDEEESAEQEAMLGEYAGEVIPALIKAGNVQELTPHINVLLPLLIKKTVSPTPTLS